MTDPLAYAPAASNEWGFRQDDEAEQAFAAVRQWRADAIAAGWTPAQTYPDPHGEDIDRAMTLTFPAPGTWRGEWVAQTLTRPRATDGKGLPCASIHVWGPDGLALDVPPRFDPAALSAACMRCSECRREGVATVRVGFAGRVCETCRQVERPGWTS